jgi:adenosylmethionine-8-amino-7-oxononanoate aminotransferase
MELIEKDKRHIWHPCAQMKDFENCPPIIVNHAKGSYLYTNKGPLIDAGSSWWCKSLGHGHPEIIAAIKKQLDSFEHVIAANTTHPLLADLGEKLTEISKKQHVFFASDGSCAVEIAMKLALHANQLKGRAHRNEFIALEQGYHGETFGALSISDLGLFKKPYEGYGVKCHFLAPLPYVSGSDDPLWFDSTPHWESVLQKLEQVKDKACALIVEPIIQGASGMRCYSADFLKKLANWAKKNDIYFIADEIMTGLGRTGKWLACEHAGVEADLICLSKGLTSGSIPLSTVLIDKAIYELFYDDYEKGKSFLHSHTFSGNALAVSAALATLQVMEREAINQRVEKLSLELRKHMDEIASLTGQLTGVRSVGAMAAADLIDDGRKRLGYQLYQAALDRGALLRPLGNTLYWLPPLNSDKETIEKLAEITLNSIRAIY